MKILLIVGAILLSGHTTTFAMPSGGDNSSSENISSEGMQAQGEAQASPPEKRTTNP